jgi:hypothetical protein
VPLTVLEDRMHAFIREESARKVPPAAEGHVPARP